MVLVLAVLMDGWMDILQVLRVIVDLCQLCPEPSTHVQRWKILYFRRLCSLDLGSGTSGRLSINLESTEERKVLVRKHR